MGEKHTEEERESLKKLDFLRRTKYPAYLAVICMIVSMLIRDGKLTANEAITKHKDIANASKGQLKRAIKDLRETAAGDLKISGEVERTVQFIRRDLLHKEERTA